MPNSPAFGEADLTNCERELIHLAGAVQPHGLLLTLSGPELQLVQISANSQALLGVSAESLVGKPLSTLGGNIADLVTGIAVAVDLDEPAPLICHIQIREKTLNFEGSVHRSSGKFLVIEIEPTDKNASQAETVCIDNKELLQHLGESINRLAMQQPLARFAT